MKHRIAVHTKLNFDIWQILSSSWRNSHRYFRLAAGGLRKRPRNGIHFWNCNPADRLVLSTYQGWNFRQEVAKTKHSGVQFKHIFSRNGQRPIFVTRISTTPSTIQARLKLTATLQLKCGLPSPCSVFCCQEHQAGWFGEENSTRERGGAAFMSCGSKLRKAFRHSATVVMVCSMGHATCPSTAK